MRRKIIMIIGIFCLVASVVTLILTIQKVQDLNELNEVLDNWQYGRNPINPNNPYWQYYQNEIAYGRETSAVTYLRSLPTTFQNQIILTSALTSMFAIIGVFLLWISRQKTKQLRLESP